MIVKLKYSELEAENVELKKALANMSLLYTTANELYKEQVKLVTYIAKKVGDLK